MPSPLTAELLGLEVEPRFKTWFARGPWTTDLEQHTVVQHILRDMEDTQGKDSRVLFHDNKGVWILVAPRDEAVQAFCALCDADDAGELIDPDYVVEELFREIQLQWSAMDVPSRLDLLAEHELSDEMAVFLASPDKLWITLAGMVLDEHFHPEEDVLLDCIESQTP